MDGKAGFNNYILILEDDESTALALELFLEEIGYYVVSAQTNDAALELINTYGLPKLVICDYFLKNGTCQNFVKRVREHFEVKSIPLILMSAWPRLEELKVDYNIVGLLRKPFELQELMDLIQTVFPLREKAQTG